MKRTRAFMSLVRRVERTEGMKFKKVPTLVYKKRIGGSVGKNVADYERQGNTVKIVKSAKVYITKNFAQNYESPFVGRIIQHELRENLYLQHGAGIHSPHRNVGSIHKKAQSWGRKDEAYLQKKYSLGDR